MGIYGVTSQAIPSGTRNGKTQYIATVNGFDFNQIIIFWNSTASRWEAKNYPSESTVLSYLSNPGSAPISTDAYNWVTVDGSYAIDLSRLTCAESLCMMFMLRPVETVGFGGIVIPPYYGQDVLYGTFVPSGIYNNKTWYSCQLNNGTTFSYVYIYWNSVGNRWEAREDFSQSLGPSGLAYGVLTNSSDANSPIGLWDNQIYSNTNPDNAWAVYSSDFLYEYDCPRYGCVEQSFNGNLRELFLVSIRHYNGKHLYYSKNGWQTGASSFGDLYIFWNSTANRWEAWSGFDDVLGGVGTLYGVLNVTTTLDRNAINFPNSTTLSGSTTFTAPNPNSFINASIEYQNCSNIPPAPTPTTSTTSTTSSTTSTTTPGPLDFQTDFACAGSTITVTSTNFTGGVPPYFVGSSPFATQAAALANTSWILSFSGSYGVGSNGTYWLAVKDSANTVVAKSVTAECTVIACDSQIAAQGESGVYKLTSNLGTGTGAVVIRFWPGSPGVPDGIRATLNGVTYNKLSSSTIGLRQGTVVGGYTIVGVNTAIPPGGTSPCVFPTGTPFASTVFSWNGTGWTNTGTTQTNTLAAGQIQTTATQTQYCTMVVPKTSIAAQTLLTEVIGCPCVGSNCTGWRVKIGCPEPLVQYLRTSGGSTALGECGKSINVPYYFVPAVTLPATIPVSPTEGDPTNPGQIQVNDYAFDDINGATPLADGFYRVNNTITANQIIQVVNGVVVSISVCP